MKKIMCLVAGLLFIFAATVVAVAPGVTLTFDRNPKGPVQFSGTQHRSAGFSCQDCHNPELFPQMEKGGNMIEMWQIFAGQQCGFCHNGEKAFAVTNNCHLCHLQRN
jgi:c(7)-type cytochrome triheme protein